MKNNQQWKLTIKIEDDYTWLMDENIPILGSSSIDALLEELEGIIVMNQDDMTISIIDGERLQEMLCFTE
jgi:hypothetical protein